MRPSPGGKPGAAPPVLAVGGYPPPRPGCLSPGPPRPQTPGYFLLVQKVPKNTPAPFGLDPRFCPIGRLQGNPVQPLKYPFFGI